MLESNQPKCKGWSGTEWSKEQSRGAKKGRREKLEDLKESGDEIQWIEQMRSEEARMSAEKSFWAFLLPGCTLGYCLLLPAESCPSQLVCPIPVQPGVRSLCRHFPLIVPSSRSPAYTTPSTSQQGLTRGWGLIRFFLDCISLPFGPGFWVCGIFGISVLVGHLSALVTSSTGASSLDRWHRCSTDALYLVAPTHWGQL